MLKIDKPAIPESIDPKLTIAEVARRYIPYTWEKVFIDCKKEIKVVSKLIEEREERYIPENVDLFRAFWLTPLNKVRVVILGQDPYPSIQSDGQTVATGLAFSIRKNNEVITSSLNNIFTEIGRTSDDYDFPDNGNLDHWAEQGVLLLNASLTVPRVNSQYTGSAANGHGKYEIWIPFVVKVLKAISVKNPNCIYVLWGRYAQGLRKYMPKKGIFLESAHPSGKVSASATNSFKGNGHFARINEILADNPIKW